ncbi:MAG TPA: phosphoenolpyruvate--protein phosphotransferase [Deltaproteobacteria bacterium]|nr:phosphoenolpyruvate--protein phosphotransferase [Deltaproteobacteria bacterium]
MPTETPSVRQLTLLAPLSGPLIPIERVPDPVFAQKMVGDGISIDPLDQTLLAPCGGEVIHLHQAGHAITILTPEGIKLLLHIGLDTVSLKGSGFTPLIKTGATVKPGDPLIRFDADYLATHAKSLMTQIVVTNSEAVEQFSANRGSVMAGIDPIMTLILADAVGIQETEQKCAPLLSEAILIPNPTGLHARPAAVLANIAKKYQCDIQLIKGDSSANAKSVVSLMGLEVGHGDKVILSARGTDAAEALENLAHLLQEGLGDEGCRPAPAPASMEQSADSAPAPGPVASDPNLLSGVTAAPGLAVGRIFQLRHARLVIDDSDSDNPQQERTRLDDALAQAHLQLDALRASLHAQRAADKAAIFAAHQELLDDPDLLDIAHSALAKGKRADFAWQCAFTTHADRLAGLRNELLAARANDLRDVGQRVLKLLTGVQPEAPAIPEDSILVAEDLTPSDAASLDRRLVRGFCTTNGGATSHVAILARSLDIPALAGINPHALDIPNGTPAVLDGASGSLRLNPPEESISEIRAQQIRQQERKQLDMDTAGQPAVTTDNQRVEVAANIGSLADAREVIGLGGEGVGLLRSEFLFMERSTAPDEQEQFETYRAIAEALEGRPLVIRTLDVGGDKPLSYLPIPKEDNPFLGERGLRVGLERPEILRTQLRAILRASTFGNIRIMFPMVGLLSELRDARAILEEERSRLGVAPVQAGIMVEIPAAAMMAAQFAREADFFSIGTNDLTQYTLAMDRGHPKLAPKVDGLNPAVLRLIHWTVQAAHAQGKWVGVCGGLASDQDAVPVLIGLGVDELSASLPAIPGIKSLIRRLSMSQCRRMAEAALQQEHGSGVRTLVRQSINTEPQGGTPSC